MACKITLGNVVIEHVNSVTIEESIKLLENKATLILPREYNEAVVNGKEASFAGANILDFIKVDNPVVIKLGYDNDIEEEFTGYISSISADIPLKVACEDEMHFLRKSNFKKSFLSLSLQELLNYIAPGYNYDIIDNISLGKFIINNESAYQVLSRLRKDYGLHARFVNKTLQVGFPISLVPKKVHEININRNVRAQQNDLKFVRKEDFKLLLKAIAINKDGKRLQEDFGDKGGAQRTLHFMNKTREVLKQLAEKNYKSLNFDGYQGSIPTWGNPRTKAGDSVIITDPNYTDTKKNIESERNGQYLIESVTKKFNGTDGFLRINKLSLKL
jgi:hypothetical protein